MTKNLTSETNIILYKKIAKKWIPEYLDIKIYFNFMSKGAIVEIYLLKTNRKHTKMIEILNEEFLKINPDLEYKIIIKNINNPEYYAKFYYNWLIHKLNEKNKINSLMIKMVNRAMSVEGIIGCELRVSGVIFGSRNTVRRIKKGCCKITGHYLPEYSDKYQGVFINKKGTTGITFKITKKLDLKQNLNQFSLDE